MRQIEFKTVFTESIPREPEQGKLYVCERYKVAIHLCPCGYFKAASYKKIMNI